MNIDKTAVITKLKALYPNAEDALLECLYDQCADEFMAVCNRDDIPQTAAFAVEQMIAFRYSQINAEGLASQSFSGMSEAFLTDYPQRLKRAMYRFRRLGMGCRT